LSDNGGGDSEASMEELYQHLHAKRKEKKVSTFTKTQEDEHIPSESWGIVHRGAGTSQSCPDRLCKTQLSDAGTRGGKKRKVRETFKCQQLTFKKLMSTA